MDLCSGIITLAAEWRAEEWNGAGERKGRRFQKSEEEMTLPLVGDILAPKAAATGPP